MRPPRAPPSLRARRPRSRRRQPPYSLRYAASLLHVRSPSTSRSASRERRVRHAQGWPHMGRPTRASSARPSTRRSISPLRPRRSRRHDPRHGNCVRHAERETHARPAKSRRANYSKRKRTTRSEYSHRSSSKYAKPVSNARHGRSATRRASSTRNTRCPRPGRDRKFANGSLSSGRGKSARRRRTTSGQPTCDSCLLPLALPRHPYSASFSTHPSYVCRRMRLTYGGPPRGCSPRPRRRRKPTR